MKRPRGLPARAIYSLVRSHWGLQHRLAEQPSSVMLDDITLHLDDRWATPEIRHDIYDGSYEQDERAILRDTLRPDDRVLELGAGAGVVTTFACRIVGERNVLAFEADPEMVMVALMTLQLNGFAPNVVNAVLGEGNTDTVQFYRHSDFWRSGLTPVDGAEPIDIPTASFHAQIEEFQPTYLIVDIEGGEVDLLRQPLPSCVRTICIEMHPAVTGAKSMQDLLVRLFDQGFLLDLFRSHNAVLHLAR